MQIKEYRFLEIHITSDELGLSEDFYMFHGIPRDGIYYYFPDTKKWYMYDKRDGHLLKVSSLELWDHLEKFLEEMLPFKGQMELF